jgi:hypothetical protein
MSESRGLMEGPRFGRGFMLLLGLLGLAMVLAHWTHPEGHFTRGGLPHGDGIYHYAAVRSLVLDGDLRLRNDLALLGNPHGQPVRDDGWTGNHFTMGTALVWVPSFVVAHAVSRGGEALGLWEDAGDGTSPRCQRITMLGSVLAGWLALVLVARLLLRWFDARAVGLVVLVAAVATPLGWYATRQPSWSHAASALAVAGLCHATLLGGPSTGPRRGAVVGLWLGLSALVRPQDLVFAIWPVGEGLAALREPRRRRAAARGLCVLLAVAGACWLPQAWVWSEVYGSAWQVPQGPEFMRWGHSHWDLVLWSSRGGLLAWSPAIGLALVGLALAAWRGPLRWPARALLSSLALDVYVCGAVDDWWGGWAFGGRRLVGGTVAFAMGWAVLVQVVLERRRGGLAARILAAVLAVGAVRLSLQMQDDYLHGRLQRDVPQPLGPAWSRAFGVPLDGVLEAVGTPGSWPASWVFAVRTGAPPGRYDLAVGWALVEARGDAKGYERLWIDDPRWALAGFGPSHPRGEHRARAVQPGAVVGVPLRVPLSLHARLRAWAAAPVTLHVDVAGEPVALSLRPGWHDYPLSRVGPWPAGLGLVVLRPAVDQGAAAVEIELAWLDLHRPGHDPLAR